MKKKKQSLHPLLIANIIGAVLFLVPIIHAGLNTGIESVGVALALVPIVWFYLTPLAIVNIFFFCKSLESKPNKQKQKGTNNHDIHKKAGAGIGILLSLVFLLFIGIPLATLISGQALLEHIPQFAIALGGCFLLGWFMFKRR